MPLDSALARIPGLAGYLGGQQIDQQRAEGELRRQSLADTLAANAKNKIEGEQISQVMKSSPTPEIAIEKLTQLGPHGVDAATKLVGLQEHKQKVETQKLFSALPPGAMEDPEFLDRLALKDPRYETLANKAREKRAAATQLTGMQGQKQVIQPDPQEIQQAADDTGGQQAAAPAPAVSYQGGDTMLAGLTQSPNEQIAKQAQALQAQIRNLPAGTNPAPWQGYIKSLADRESALVNRPEQPLTPYIDPVTKKPVLGTRTEAYGKEPASQFSQVSAIPDEHSNLSGAEYLKTLPAGLQNTVKAIAEGRAPLTSVSIRNNQREAMLQRVQQYDPTFEAGKAPARMAVYKDFTSGPTSRNVTAINTGISHLGSMYDLANGMQNQDFPAINRAINFLKTQTGDASINNFETARDAVANELMRVFRQVGASESEVKEWGSRFRAYGSPAQLKGGIKTAGELLKGRIDAINDQWDRGMDRTGGYPQLLAPRSRNALERFGVKLAPAGQGGTGDVPGWSIRPVNG